MDNLKTVILKAKMYQMPQKNERWEINESKSQIFINNISHLLRAFFHTFQFLILLGMFWPLKSLLMGYPLKMAF